MHKTWKHLQLFAEEGEAAQEPNGDGGEGLPDSFSEESPETDYTPHLERLFREGSALERRMPGVRFREELKNPAFQYLTSPAVGLDVETAYFALHRRALLRSAILDTMQRTASAVSNAIASGSMRPREFTGSANGRMVSKSYTQMSKTEREAFRKRVMDSQYSGQKVYL